MCGLSAWIVNGNISSKGFNKFNDIIKHRGPDAYCVSNFELGHLNVRLGHRRLSIIDLTSAADQPMKYKQLSIIFNGEIFNYAELVKKYKDFAPKTVCDTELLAWGLDRIGLDFIEEIDSMHAFAYYKPKENE